MAHEYLCFRSGNFSKTKRIDRNFQVAGCPPNIQRKARGPGRGWGAGDGESQVAAAISEGTRRKGSCKTGHAGGGGRLCTVNTGIAPRVGHGYTHPAGIEPGGQDAGGGRCPTVKRRNEPGTLTGGSVKQGTFTHGQYLILLPQWYFHSGAAIPKEHVSGRIPGGG